MNGVDKLEEAKRLIEEGWRPYWNKRRNLIVFKRGNETRSIGLTYELELYRELLEIYKEKAKPEEYEEIEKAIREARTPSRPIEKARIDRLAEYETLVTELGRAVIEIYSDVTVDPEQLAGKSPEERAEIKAKAIIEVMKREHRPHPPEQHERDVARKMETDRQIHLLLLEPLSWGEWNDALRYYDHLIYIRLFMETVKHLSLRRSDLKLFKEALDVWNKLQSDEEFMRRIDRWAFEKSGLQTIMKIYGKMDYVLSFDVKKSRYALEMASELKKEWEEVKKRRENVDYAEPLSS